MASPSGGALPGALLKAASLVAKHKQQQQTLEKQEEQVQTLTKCCDTQKGVIEELTSKLSTALALVAQTEATGLANLAAIRTTVTGLEDANQSLQEQLEAQCKKSEALAEQLANRPTATAGRLLSDVSTESELTRGPDGNEGTTQQARDAGDTVGEGSSESGLSQVLEGNQDTTQDNTSMTLSERARFLDQFSYDVSPRLQRLFHKNVLTRAEFEAARLATTQDGPQITASPDQSLTTTPQILSSPPRRTNTCSASPTARATERRESREEQEAVSRSPIPDSPLVVHEDQSDEQIPAAEGQEGPEEQQIASLGVHDSFSVAQNQQSAQNVNDRRKSKRLRGRQPTFDGKTVDESPRDGLPRVPLATVVNGTTKQGLKNKSGRQGGPTKAKKRKR